MLELLHKKKKRKGLGVFCYILQAFVSIKFGMNQKSRLDSQTWLFYKPV